MALKKNVFTTDLMSFLDSIVSYDHYRFLMNSQLEKAKERTEKTLDTFKEKGFANQFIAGSALGIIDIFDRGEWIVRTPVGSRVIAGHEAISMIDELERRFNSLLLVSLFERLEVYLVELYGKMLYQMRRELSISDKQKFHKANNGWSKREGTPAYYLQYAKYSCKRDCSKILNEFRKHLDWSNVFISRWAGMQFEELILALAFCRHCIVHNDGRVADTSLLNNAQRKFVKGCQHNALHSKENLLLPENKIVDDCFEIMASYGRGIYVLLANRCQMADETVYFKAK